MRSRPNPRKWALGPNFGKWPPHMAACTHNLHPMPHGVAPSQLDCFFTFGVGGDQTPLKKIIKNRQNRATPESTSKNDGWVDRDGQGYRYTNWGAGMSVPSINPTIFPDSSPARECGEGDQIIFIHSGEAPVSQACSFGEDMGRGKHD